MIGVMDRVFVTVGASSALIAVAAGAFGAHALRDRIPVDLLDVFETGARYQMYHALALVALGVYLSQFAGERPLLVWSGWLLVVGTFLFSGSLYLLSLTGVRWLGAVTPLGGIAFLAGWALLAVAAWRSSAPLPA